MTPAAAYDDIADWYEHEFLSGAAGLDRHPLEIGTALRDLLGTGTGPCLEIGCGTGAWADQVRDLGRTPVGADLSAAMLAFARPRLPVVRSDASRLPFRTAAVAAAVTVMAHTDMPRYPDVLREIARVVRPGGVFVHVGVHPCLSGGFADRSDPAAVVIGPDYRRTYWTTASWNTSGLRDKVGATHLPLAALFDAFRDAGFGVERLFEGGAPVPGVLAVRLRRLASVPQGDRECRRAA